MGFCYWLIVWVLFVLEKLVCILFLLFLIVSFICGKLMGWVKFLMVGFLLIVLLWCNGILWVKEYWLFFWVGVLMLGIVRLFIGRLF